MSINVAKTFILRLEEYLSQSEGSVFITFHGGEPLLEDKSFYEEIAQNLLDKRDRVHLNIQTNGTLIDKEWCDIFNKYNISIGISLDGNEQANGCRKFRNGTYAYHHIIEGYKLLVENKVRHGILSVINTHVSPIVFYNHFKSLDVQYIDCLLPDANYESYNASNIGIGMWLCQLFNIWFFDKNRFSIRIFESIIKLILLPSSDVGGEMFGNTKNAVVDISPNGNIDVPDTLKICNLDLKGANYSIFNNKLTDIYNDELFQRFYSSHTDSYISSKCKSCLIREICGGGILAHRYSKKRQFDNPSVYCHELFYLVMHIQNALCSQMDVAVIDKIDINDFNAW